MVCRFGDRDRFWKELKSKFSFFFLCCYIRFCPIMALYSQFVVMLFYGWSYLCVGYCAMLKTDNFPERRTAGFTHAVYQEHPVKADQHLLSQDTMTEHMQMLYTKYNQAGFPFKDGNTVRSFKAHWGKCPTFYALKFTMSVTKMLTCVSDCLNFGCLNFGCFEFWLNRLHQLGLFAHAYAKTCEQFRHIIHSYKL